MLFLAMLFRLASHEEGAPLPREAYAQAYQEFLQFFQESFPQEQTPCSARIRDFSPLSLAILINRKNMLLLRATFLLQERGNTLSAFFTTLQHQPTWTLCGRRYTLTDCDLTNQLWAALSTWNDFQTERCATDASVTTFHLRFLTPLLTAEIQDTTALPFPEPLPFFTHLNQRWCDLGGPPLPTSLAESIEKTHCVVSHYQLHIQPASHSQDHSPLGYHGKIDYLCQRGEPEGLTTLHRLARLAFFTGCGRGTLLGNGLTQITYQHKEVHI